MKRWVIKHIASDRVYVEDESGSYLVDPKEGIFSWGDKSTADDYLADMSDGMTDGNSNIITEMGEFPVDEFQVVEI